MGLPVENELLAISSAQNLELKKKNCHTKNLSSLNYKYCVNKSRGMSRDHFLKIVNNWRISGGFEKKNQAITFFSFI